MPFGNFFFPHKKRMGKGRGTREKKIVIFKNAVCD